MTSPFDETLPPDQGFLVRTVWEEGLLDDAQFVNQFAVTQAPSVSPEEDDGGFYLAFGHVGPPMLLTPEDTKAFFEGGPRELKVKSYGAYYLSESRAKQLVQVLAEQLGRKLDSPR
ncbi:hypothetical protein ACFWGN_20600 [Oerskovia sp. NPDC060338]|uniref:hypothetical protein n=1 Tax=Oerskovia sp. NPDC060338 TaxID=3347100 RepID=UPI003653998D